MKVLASSGGWNFVALTMATSVAISARTLLDTDMDGIMDAGEQPIEAAVHRQRHQASTAIPIIAQCRDPLR